MGGLEVVSMGFGGLRPSFGLLSNSCTDPEGLSWGLNKRFRTLNVLVTRCTELVSWSQSGFLLCLVWFGCLIDEGHDWPGTDITAAKGKTAFAGYSQPARIYSSRYSGLRLVSTHHKSPANLRRH